MDSIISGYRAISHNVMSKVVRWWWGSDPDKANDVSGMSLRDVYNVQRSWANIYANALVNGLLVFNRIFSADPQSQKFFKYVADASEEERATNVTFKAHVVNIMSALNNAVVNLHQPEIVVSLMEKLGESHHANHIQRRHFLLFRDVVLNIVQIDLKYGAEIVTSWALFLEFINKQIFTKVSI